MTLQNKHNKAQIGGYGIAGDWSPGGRVAVDCGATASSAALVSDIRISAGLRPVRCRVSWFSLEPIGVGCKAVHYGQHLLVTMCRPGTAKCDNPLDIANFGRVLQGYQIEAEGTN
jgi:hypothetical protein